MSHNECTLIGRLGKDPVVKDFPDGGKVAEFSFATSEKWKTKGGEDMEKTEWHNIKITNKNQAAIAQQYLKKGALVFIKGKMTLRQYDRNYTKDNVTITVTHYITEVIVEKFEMLEKRQDNQPEQQEQRSTTRSNQSQSTSRTNQEQRPTVQPEDDLPF